ncbi:aldehyde dehydrogenase family protein [Acinetobacter indicus]|uniref:aldehyde dehydrogenase family protein n=1 Tax=Acinetobacter indicus TaxID=756892 RepID=UPI002578C92D|nr:aldehyde dehydrogenase family protein [Acinetobacter indicus]MDM1304121.1 aldehyde dehydrogenase family protein [Acinetobacter indicus]
MGAYQFLDQQFIAGEWIKGTSTRILDNLNPYTQESILKLQGASIVDVDSAYAAALEYAAKWADSSAEARKNLLLRVIEIIQARREEIIDWLIQESGSTRLKANIEVDAAIGILKESSTFPERMLTQELPSPDSTRQSYAVRKPLGVVAVISAWNFPFHLSMRSVAAALALGNTVVLKPASDTPITGGLLLAKLFEEAGAPVGSLSVLAGAGSEIGDYFVEHEVPKLISFTGSTEVGKRVGQLAVGSPNLKRLALELGGNAPLVVLDDADLDLAVELAVMGRFLHQGQICMSTNRIIVDAKVHDSFVGKLVERSKSIPFGDPNEDTTVIGPIINRDQVQKIQHIIQQGQEAGATLVLQGATRGHVIPPHIFIDVDPASSLAQEESFGPVLPVIKAQNEAEALMLANATRFGLSSAVCSANIERAKAFALKIDAGMTHINAITVADYPNAPFGGEKNSGLGRFNGQWVLEEFCRTHWLTLPS